MGPIETVAIEVLLNSKKAQMGLKQFNKQLKTLNKPVKSLTGMFGKLFRFAGIAGFAKMAFDAQKLGRELGLISDKTGIAASKLSKMQSAFAATGGDAKSLSNVLTNITSGLAKLSMGSGEMAAKLSAMGISAWDEGGNVKTADIVLGDIAEWTKSQLAMGRSMQEVSTYLKENFGIEQDLANQLALGRSGFNKYQEAMAKKVGSLNEDEISNLQSLNASLSRFKETVTVLVDKITAGLAPALEFVIDIFQFIAKELQEFFDEVFAVFKDLTGDGEELSIIFAALKEVVKGIVEAFKVLVDIIGFILAAFKALGEELGKAFAWLFGGNDDDKKSAEDRIDELVAQGYMTQEQANIARVKGGHGRKGEKLDLRKPISEEPLPIVDENGNLVDLSQVPNISNSNSNTNVEANVTNNFYGDVDKVQVEEGVSEGLNVGIAPALSGG